MRKAKLHGMVVLLAGFATFCLPQASLFAADTAGAPPSMVLQAKSAIVQCFDENGGDAGQLAASELNGMPIKKYDASAGRMQIEIHGKAVWVLDDDVLTNAGKTSNGACQKTARAPTSPNRTQLYASNGAC